MYNAVALSPFIAGDVPDCSSNIDISGSSIPWETPETKTAPTSKKKRKATFSAR
jgi:hypothetical protein